MNKRQFKTLILLSFSLFSFSIVGAQENLIGTPVNNPESIALVSVSASTDVQAIQMAIAGLATEYNKLKAQVVSGQITKEQARSTWQALVEKVRSAKKEVFTKRVERLDQKVKEISEKNPERASLISEKMNAIKDRRTEVEAKRMETKEKVKAGTMTREEALKERKDLFIQKTAVIKEVRNEAKEMRAENKSENNEKRDFIKEAKTQVREGIKDVKEARKEAVVEIKALKEKASNKVNIVGSDKDEHGCIGSAGYSWCSVKSKCIRSWEEKCEIGNVVDLKSTTTQQ